MHVAFLKREMMVSWLTLHVLIYGGESAGDAKLRVKTLDKETPFVSILCLCKKHPNCREFV